MNPLTQSTHAPPVDADEPRWIAVQRVAHSKVFERSNRLQSFLLDVSWRALDGRIGEINEQQIGMRVFGKSTGYNSAEDNTVRVHARLLRQKLKEYYAGEGAADSIRIEIPKGGYVPRFEHWEAAPQSPVFSPPAPLGARSPWHTRALAALSIARAIAVVWLWVQNRRVQALLPAAAPESGPLTSLVIGKGQKTTVVLSDSALVVAQELTQRDVSLEGYAGSGYRKDMDAVAVPDGANFWEYLLSRRYTSMADVNLYGRLLQFHPESWPNLEVRHARDMRLADFRQHNFVLLGSPRSNPWLQAFEDKLNFQFSSPGARGRTTIRNRQPRSGEPAEFASDLPDGSGKGFAYVALFPNLTDTGNVLMIGGVTMAATEAVAEFACDRNAEQKLARLWSLTNLHGIRSFELVFETWISAETVKSSRLVASRHTLKK